MLGLNEEAMLRGYLGRRSGRSVYEEPGKAFRCRCERAFSGKASGDAERGSATIRVFAEAGEGFHPRPGDRIDLGGESYRVTEVRYLGDLHGLHHLEIEAREAGDSRGR